MAVPLVVLIAAMDDLGIDEHRLVVADGHRVGLAEHVPALADWTVRLLAADIDTVALAGVAEQVGRVALGDEFLSAAQVQGAGSLVDLDAETVE